MEPKDALLLSVTHDSPRSACTIAGLKEHPLASRDMWLASVNAGATDAGYWEWAEDTLCAAWADLQLKLPPVHAKRVAAPRALMAQAKAAVKSPAPSLEDVQKLIQGDF